MNLWDYCDDADRIIKEDGHTLYGFDQDDGTTDWYTEDGTLDCSTDTPGDEEADYDDPQDDERCDDDDDYDKW